jgi:hypothetical protein
MAIHAITAGRSAVTHAARQIQQIPACNAARFSPPRDRVKFSNCCFSSAVSAISTLPRDTPLKALIKMAEHRWIIERDYQELKQELGLGHFEGRNWRGFHHHATLCIAAYGFLVAERNRFSPLPAPVILDSLPHGQRRSSARADRLTLGSRPMVSLVQDKLRASAALVANVPSGIIRIPSRP